MATSPAIAPAKPTTVVTDRGKVVFVTAVAVLVVLVLMLSVKLMSLFSAPSQQLEVLKLGLIASINMGQLPAIRYLRTRAAVTFVVSVTAVEICSLYLLGPLH